MDTAERLWNVKDCSTNLHHDKRKQGCTVINDLFLTECLTGGRSGFESPGDWRLF